MYERHAWVHRLQTDLTMMIRRHLQGLAVVSALAMLCIGVARELSAQKDSSAMLRCYELARSETLLDSNDAQELCRGASTIGPVSCYMAGDDETFLDTTDLLQLCRCADSAEPAICYVRAREETDLWFSDALQFCSPIFVHHLWPDCTSRQDETIW